jgi:UPF0716 protein FxsA
MLGKLLLAFILVPLGEFFLLVWIADRTSIWTTFGLVIITGIIGSLLARAEGLKALNRFREASREGRIPGREIQDGLLIAFAAALLLTPGLITDCVGFLLLMPKTRGVVREFLAKRLKESVRVKVISRAQHAGGTVDATSWSTAESQPERKSLDEVSKNS